MISLSEYIFESKSDNSIKPIHLLKNDGIYCNERGFQECMNSILEDWPAALQDDHEDEYVYVTSDNERYKELFNKYCLNNKSVDGWSTRGIGRNFYGWSKHNTEKYPVWYMRRGTQNRRVTKGVLLLDRHML